MASSIWVSVTVGNREIQDGKVCHAGECPIAQAINRELDGSFSASAGIDQIALYSANSLKRWSVETPPNVRRFMQQYDCGGHVEPFTFDLQFHLDRNLSY